MYQMHFFVSGNVLSGNYFIQSSQCPYELTLLILNPILQALKLHYRIIKLLAQKVETGFETR